jgi:hypothetical protein
VDAEAVSEDDDRFVASMPPELVQPPAGDMDAPLADDAGDDGDDSEAQGDADLGTDADAQSAEAAAATAPAAGNFQSKGSSAGAAARTRAARPLVVVASLVDKATNLAGLTRTCEVVGVERLALASLRVTADPLFQQIALSAERWAPLEEVPPAQLAAWLRRQRDRGYTLVGVEQTAGSTPLHQFRFPERCVVVLGREREGLPAELIHMVRLAAGGVERALTCGCRWMHVWRSRRRVLCGRSMCMCLAPSRSGASVVGVCCERCC